MIAKLIFFFVFILKGNVYIFYQFLTTRSTTCIDTDWQQEINNSIEDFVFSTKFDYCFFFYFIFFVWLNSFFVLFSVNWSNNVQLTSELSPNKWYDVYKKEKKNKIYCQFGTQIQGSINLFVFLTLKSVFIGQFHRICVLWTSIMIPDITRHSYVHYTDYNKIII